jgi:hypothetical protein
MMIGAKTWLTTTALVGALVSCIGSRANAEMIHEWTFEETIGTSPIDTDGGPDTFSQNLNLVGATQVNSAATNPPAGLGSQALKTGDGLTTTPVGGQKASVWSTTGVPGIGYKGLSSGTASLWVYRTGDQIVGNNSSTLFTVERDASAGGGGRISVQVVMPNSAGTVPAARGVVGSLTLSGREGPGNSTRMTYNTTVAQGSFVPLNTWTHIVAVWDYANGDPDGDANPDPDNDGLFGGTMLLYVNGSPILGGTYANFWPDDGANDTNSLTALDSNGIVLGSGNADPAVVNNQEEFEGLIDALQLYDVALGEDEVLSLYESFLVPEPSTLALVALGALALVGRRRVS